MHVGLRLWYCANFVCPRAALCGDRARLMRNANFVCPCTTLCGEIAARTCDMCHAGMLFVPSLSPFYAFAVGYCVLLLASLSPIVSLLVSLLRLCCWMLRPPSSCLLSSLPSTPLLLDAVPAFSPTVSLLVLFFFPFLSPFYAFVCCWMLLRFWQASLIVPLACLLFCFSPSPCWWRRKFSFSSPFALALLSNAAPPFSQLASCCLLPCALHATFF